MERNSLQIFDFEGHQTRVVMIDGAPWWVISDVCDVLRIKNARNVANRLPKDDVCQTDIIDSMGRKQKSNITNESGIYELIFRSGKPEAQVFRHFVTHEVLPSIRKHGAYITPQKLDDMSNNPELITTLLEAFKDERNKVKQLERQIQDNALNTSSGQILQDSFCNKKTVVIGQFNKIQREGNLILAWLSSNETPVVGYTGMDTDIHRDKGCNVYHLDYDFSTISEKE